VFAADADPPWGLWYEGEPAPANWRSGPLPSPGQPPGPGSAPLAGAAGETAELAIALGGAAVRVTLWRITSGIEERWAISRSIDAGTSWLREDLPLESRIFFDVVQRRADVLIPGAEPGTAAWRPFDGDALLAEPAAPASLESLFSLPLCVAGPVLWWLDESGLRVGNGSGATVAVPGFVESGEASYRCDEETLYVVRGINRELVEISRCGRERCGASASTSLPSDASQAVVSGNGALFIAALADEVLAVERLQHDELELVSLVRVPGELSLSALLWWTSSLHALVRDDSGRYGLIKVWPAPGA
jgi:hypothetical protein